jgi:8-oxo-dGTP pyrophosphatase MutT (NUDIX family)
LPGGKVDLYESATAATAREIAEELGITDHPTDLLRIANQIDTNAPFLLGLADLSGESVSRLSGSSRAAEARRIRLVRPQWSSGTADLPDDRRSASYKASRCPY